MRERPTHVASVGLAYLGVFLVLGWPWLSVANHAVPYGNGLLLQQERDGELICWILAWVSHALTTWPSRLYDAPINWPLPHQLTGSEHLLSSQLVAAPVWLATGNATLTGTVTLFATYPLGAFVMWALLRALGMRTVSAWVGGLIFALGPLCAPANLQVLQYVPLWLPLLALTLRRLAERPTWMRTAHVALAFIGAVLSSYYLAVMAGIAAIVWSLVEMAMAPAGRRWRFAGHAVAGALPGLAILAAVTLPYLARPDSDGWLSRWGATLYSAASDFVMSLLAREVGITLAVLALAGACFVRSSDRMARHAACAGLALLCVGAAFGVGPRPFGCDLPWSPYAMLAASPAAIFRAWFRFVVLAGFGASVLAAVTLDACARRRRFA